MNSSDLTSRQRTEVEFWRDSAAECPESDSIDNIINKVSEAGIFINLARTFADDFVSSKQILELGGGQGWASCIIKRLFPHLHITATDISEYAVASINKWEHVYQTRVDKTFPCLSYQIPVPDASLDLVFCFAAAHHFAAHRRTFNELNRVLRPGGVCLYLYEPACQPLLYQFAYKRVNKKRPEVPEDVLIVPKLAKLASESGFNTEPHYYPNTHYRSLGASIYYMILSRITFLQRILPCTVNFRFTKR